MSDRLTERDEQFPDYGDLEWARSRVIDMCASAFTDARLHGAKLLKGFGYPNEVFGRAQDARALATILSRFDAPTQPCAGCAALREEVEKYRTAASVLCGAHIGVPQPACPVCMAEKWLAAFNRSEQFQSGPTHRAEKAEAQCAALREALKENMAEIRQQAGTHYAGCNCTFCSVIARSETAIAPSQPDGTPDTTEDN